MYDLIAILGRGIQKDKSAWSLTEEIEVCDKNSAHLIDRVSPDDENPCSMIGGGELNLIAGKILIENQDIKPPKIVVCAYGHRAQYLEDADAPTESEVMSEQLKPFIPEETELLVWDKHRYPKPLVPSNTRQEMLNVLDLALEKKCSRVGGNKRLRVTMLIPYEQFGFLRNKWFQLLAHNLALRRSISIFEVLSTVAISTNNYFRGLDILVFDQNFTSNEI
jgi:hypothetical protein